MPVPAGVPEVRQLLRPEQEVDQVHLRNLPLLCHKIQVINGERDVKEKKSVKWLDFSINSFYLARKIHTLLAGPESTKQMEEKRNYQVPAEGLKLVILLHTQY